MKPTLGFALTGSFCTLKNALFLMESLKERYEIIPIVSEQVARTDTRFFQKEELLQKISELCERKPLTTLVETEPLGPEKTLDLLLICPCTGNTLSKMALGITDTCVTMAAKSHRRNGGKVLIALSTNDALSGSAKSLGLLADRKNYFFVPMHQDEPKGKPASLQCQFSMVPEAVDAALAGGQLQPIFF